MTADLTSPALTNRAAPTLLPCPFCGSEAREERPHRDSSMVYCGNQDCPARPNTGWCYDSDKSAAACWNTRAVQP